MERRAGCLVAGIDEAGRGPLAGPVVAAAVVLPDDPAQVPSGIDDSKALAPARRAELCDALRQTALIGVGIASVFEIDFHNILQATLMAMARAVMSLPLAPGLALVDGNQLPNIPCPARAVVGGDRTSLSIAAASVIAKVTRDRIMEGLAAAHPAYGWEHNRGYATAEHRRAIRAVGITLHHRRSFAPVRAAELGQSLRFSP